MATIEDLNLAPSAPGSRNYEVERLQQRIHDLEHDITRINELWTEATRERGKLIGELVEVSKLLEAGASTSEILGVVNRALLR